jgi:hypothetical protein
VVSNQADDVVGGIRIEFEFVIEGEVEVGVVEVTVSLVPPGPVVI